MPVFFRKKKNNKSEQKAEALETAETSETAEESKAAELSETASSSPKTSPLAALSEEFYDSCYYVGALFLRGIHRVHRKASQLFHKIRTNYPSAFRRWKKKTSRRLNKLSDDLLFPYRIIAKETGDLWRRLKARGSRQEGALTPKESFHIYIRATERPYNRIANFFAPIIGLAILAGVVGYFNKLTFAVKVDYNGETLGFIEDEQQFYDARNNMLELLINEEYIPPAETIPTLSIAVARENELLTEDELVKAIMEASGNELTSASGFYLDGQFLGAVENGNEFLLYIDEILSHYRTGEEHELVQFTKNITLKDGVYPRSSILSISTLQDYLRSNERLERTYTALAGETISTIAKRYSTTPEELFRLNRDMEDYLTDLRMQLLGYDVDAPEDAEEAAANGETDDRMLDAGTKAEKPKEETKESEETEETPPEEETPDIALEDVPLMGGEEILVARIRVNLGIQITRRETYIGKIPFGTTYVEDSTRPEGFRSTISYGIPGTEEILADITYVDGVEVSETVISRKPLTEPVNQRVKIGTMNVSEWLGNTGGNFIWPVDGGYFNGSLGSYRGHTGMDIAAHVGTTVRASKSGYVKIATNAGWNGGYGRTVLIDHGGGVITRYAHMSRVVVQPGQYVEVGQVIGYVGASGNATGPHLHFEIRIGGSIMAPENYIGKYCPRKI